MPASLSIRVAGIESFEATLRRVAPPTKPLARFLRKAGLLVQRIATTEMILRGGKGPPHPTMLTSRTGALRRSIGVDETEIPFRVTVGSNLVYAAVHELGVDPFPPRPYLAPALEKAAEKFEAMLDAEIAKELA
jgi:phage gpG-like protein